MVETGIPGYLYQPSMYKQASWGFVGEAGSILKLTSTFKQELSSW